MGRITCFNMDMPFYKDLPYLYERHSNRETGKDTVSKMCSICFFSPRMTKMARAEPSLIQVPGNPSRYPMSLAGFRALGPSSFTFPSTFQEARSEAEQARLKLTLQNDLSIAANGLNSFSWKRYRTQVILLVILVGTISIQWHIHCKELSSV